MPMVNFRSPVLTAAQVAERRANRGLPAAEISRRLHQNGSLVTTDKKVITTASKGKILTTNA